MDVVTHHFLAHVDLFLTLKPQDGLLLLVDGFTGLFVIVQSANKILQHSTGSISRSSGPESFNLMLDSMIAGSEQILSKELSTPLGTFLDPLQHVPSSLGRVKVASRCPPVRPSDDIVQKLIKGVGPFLTSSQPVLRVEKVGVVINGRLGRALNRLL